MNYVVDFHEESLRDSEQAYIRYELKETGLGERFLEELQRKIERIGAAPLLFSSKSKKQYREAKLKNFPFLIVYKVYPRKKRIFVSAIHHTSLDPRKKYRKE